MHHDFSKYSLLGTLLILLYFSYLTLQPFLTYLFFSIILVFVFHPVYQWSVNKTKKPKLSSFLLVLLLILLLIIPSFFAGISLIRQAPQVYADAVNTVDLSIVDSLVEEHLGVEIDAQQELNESVPRFRSFVLNNVGAFLSGATNLFIGLFIMFFSMYYLFTQGDRLLQFVRNIIPLSQKHQKKLLSNIKEVVHAIINGQVLLGVIQGVLGGIILLILGVPNAVVWGFVMIITSIIPVLGSFVVWIPIALWLFIIGDVAQAIILALFGSVVIAQADNLLRPYVISKQADIHPVLVIVGVFGGLIAFGPAGFITGPLVLALLVTVLKFYSEELSA